MKVIRGKKRYEISNTASIFEPNLVTALSKLQISEKFSDVLFTFVDGSEIRGHKCILSCRSEKFRAMFDSGMEESNGRVNIMDHRKETFNIFLKFLYTGVVGIQDLNEDNCMEILELAESYMVQELKKYCEQFLSKSINTANLKLLIEISDTFKLNQLKRLCYKYVYSDYTNVKKDKILEELDKRYILDFIDCCMTGGV